MGRKPSMFSRNYRRQMRKRRIKYISIAVIVVVVLVGILIAASFDTIGSNIRDVFYFSKEKSSKEEQNEEPVVEKENSEKEEQAVTAQKEESFEVTLESKKAVKIVYIVDGETMYLKEVKGDDKITFNISPSKKKVILTDKATQDIYLIDINKSILKVTKKDYVSTKKQTFTKESVLNQIQNYVWVDSATFIDDTHIAYISNLPWINNSGVKYLWIYNITTGEHSGYYNIKGNNFQFGPITEKGLTLNIDNNTMYIDVNGNVTK